MIREVVDHREWHPVEIVEHLFQLLEESTHTIPSDDRTAVLLRGGV